MAGTVEATRVRPCNWPRNATGGADVVGVAPGALEPADVEVEADEQAVAARPRPIRAARILAW